MDARKVAIVVLVALVAIFVVILAAGARGGRDSSDKDPVEALEGLRSGRLLALGDDATTTCPTASERFLTLSGACTVDVADRGFLSRPTRAVLRATSGVAVVEIAPRDGPVQRLELSEGECEQAVISGDGGTLTFAPVALGAEVELLDASCPED